MRACKAVLFAAILLLAYSVSPVYSQTTINGQTLGIDTTWDSSMNPIFITGDITIPDTITLTIGEGCDIRFQENSDDTHWGWDILRSEIIVYGTLNINGTALNGVTLTSTGTGSKGWFGVIFSDDTAGGTIDYCNISRAVFGINFTACTNAPSPPTVSDCLITDVESGIYFDNSSSPAISDSTIIHAGVAFDCWALSSPTITNCNAANLTGDAMAVYATEAATPSFIGCAFTSGSVELDYLSDVYMQDTTISDSVNGVIGHEYLGFGEAKLLSYCKLELDNCNVIGLGDRGNGIEWDDNLNILKVEYGRIAGFEQNVWPRWGSEDCEAGIYHVVGPRHAGVIYGECTGGDNTTLVDDTVDFNAIGGYVGMTVTNDTDASTGIVTDIISIPPIPISYNTLVIGAGMSGGATNDAGDFYHFTRGTDPNNIDLGDMNNADPYRFWPPGYVDYSDGENEFYGVQNPSCEFNIEMEQSGMEPPDLYQLEVWAENNWWITTNDNVISRYIWDYTDYDLLGGVHYVPHRVPDEKRSYSVSGRIVDTLGDPVEGVRVSTDISVQFPGHTVLADITGSDGYYTIYGLLPHATSYTVVPEKLYYTFSPVSISVSIDPAAPTDVTDQDFTATALAPPEILSVGRTDGQDGADYGLPGSTNWGLESETTCITITGINFRDTPTVFLRGPLPAVTDTACSNVVWVTSTQLTATVPAGMSTGDYSVLVRNPDGQQDVWGDATTPGFTIVSPPAPVVTGIGPNPININYSGPLTVTGQNFVTGCEVTIGSYTWPPSTPSGGGTSLTVNYSPGTLSAGIWSVVVRNPDSQASNVDVTLTVNNPPPTATPTVTPTPTATSIPTTTPGLTATPTHTPIPSGFPSFQVSTNTDRYGVGDGLLISFELSPGYVFDYNYVDVYVAVSTPGGRRYFLKGGRWHSEEAAIFSGMFIGASTTGTLGVFSVGAGWAKGTYTLYGVLTTPGKSVYDVSFWRSALCTKTFVIE